jgi:hypothetical protein
MTDRHIHILQHLARRARRDLDQHPDPDGAGDAVASISRREHLRQAAQRTGQQVAAAEQRRRPAPSTRGTRHDPPAVRGPSANGDPAA